MAINNLDTVIPDDATAAMPPYEDIIAQAALLSRSFLALCRDPIDRHSPLFAQRRALSTDVKDLRKAFSTYIDHVLHHRNTLLLDTDLDDDGNEDRVFEEYDVLLCELHHLLHEVRTVHESSLAEATGSESLDEAWRNLEQLCSVPDGLEVQMPASWREDVEAVRSYVTHRHAHSALSSLTRGADTIEDLQDRLAWRSVNESTRAFLPALINHLGIHHSGRQRRSSVESS